LLKLQISQNICPTYQCRQLVRTMNVTAKHSVRGFVKSEYCQNNVLFRLQITQSTLKCAIGFGVVFWTAILCIGYSTVMQGSGIA